MSIYYIVIGSGIRTSALALFEQEKFKSTLIIKLRTASETTTNYCSRENRRYDESEHRKPNCENVEVQIISVAVVDGTHGLEGLLVKSSHHIECGKYRQRGWNDPAYSTHDTEDIVAFTGGEIFCKPKPTATFFWGGPKFQN